VGSNLAATYVLPLKVLLASSVTLVKQKNCFYRSVNAIFGRVGRIAKENVTVKLLNEEMFANIIIVRHGSFPL